MLCVLSGSFYPFFHRLQLSVKQQLLIVTDCRKMSCVGSHRLLTASNYVERIGSHTRSYTHSHTLMYTCAFRKDHCAFQIEKHLLDLDYLTSRNKGAIKRPRKNQTCPRSKFQSSTSQILCTCGDASIK